MAQLKINWVSYRAIWRKIKILSKNPATYEEHLCTTAQDYLLCQHDLLIRVYHMCTVFICS